VVGSHLLGVRKAARICVRHLVESEQERFSINFGKK
jgi:hypothetical protein